MQTERKNGLTNKKKKSTIKGKVKLISQMVEMEEKIDKTSDNQKI